MKNLLILFTVFLGLEKLIHHSEENYTSSYLLKINTFNVEKLTKAFNHLCKLCGAQEPISFD